MTPARTPTRWADPRYDGAGHWRHTPEHEPPFTDRLIPFVLCLLLAVVFVAAVTVGQDLMCIAHDNAISYCPGYQPESTSPGGGVR